MKVSTVIVSMNRPEILRACLYSLFAYNRTEMEVFVVACRYPKETLDILRSEFPPVKFVESEGTRGFSENNNLALRQASGEYIFIVNDDTEQEMPVVDRLVADLDRLPEKVAAVSPKIVLPSGKVQTCGRAPWGMCRYMRHYLHLVNERIPTRWSCRKGLFETRTLNGACFLARASAFREAGWFDERFFFTPEDIALGQKLVKMGYGLYADANTVIVHKAGSTVGPMEAAIKPARVRGAMLYYAGERSFKRAILGSFIHVVESLRCFKYLIIGHKSGRKALMFTTARNVRESVFSLQSPKEIFIRYAG